MSHKNVPNLQTFTIIILKPSYSTTDPVNLMSSVEEYQPIILPDASSLQSGLHLSHMWDRDNKPQMFADVPVLVSCMQPTLVVMTHLFLGHGDVPTPKHSTTPHMARICGHNSVNQTKRSLTVGMKNMKSVV